MKIHKIKAAALAMLCVGTLAVSVQADTIVDTGTPDNSIGWWFSNSQHFGAEFSVTDATVITSIEGYFSNSNGAAGNVTFSLHADGGYIPGGVLYSSVLGMSSSDPLAWYGVSGLNWNIAAGTYWVSFMPDGNIDGTMPDAAPNPLAQYGQSNGSNNWQGNFPGSWSHLHLGVRINGDTSSVPDHGSIALMWGLVSLAGVALHRRHRRA